MPDVTLRETPVPGNLPRFEIPGWRTRHGLVAGITGRGAGSVPYDLGLWSMQPVGEVMTRWKELRSAEGCLGSTAIPRCW